jgi:glutathione synthase/RimK-type ligase-like ATP-grasp enzyme
MYDERLYILSAVLKMNIYPSLEELLIYENKRFLAYWLKANSIPHPQTWVFYHKEEARDFAKECSLPIVAKMAIGAAGSGVAIIKDRKKLEKYVDDIFSGKGVARKWGPNLRKVELSRRVMDRMKDIPGAIAYFRNKYVSSRADTQKMFAILQEYIDCDFEWRAVRIGDSYFAHKKLRSFGEMFSGTSKVSWEGPSSDLLDFVKKVCDKRNFLCQAVDIFEDRRGRFLVNELQSFFGSQNPHQMIINGKPGRYIDRDSRWSFEEGDFNVNNSYDLRLDHVIRLLKDRGL